ncbi:hypothetical protein STCU_10607 [Strigomonas culicis]|uniref:Uncharacterized protein n=1 Tax=Strigomonas culicis TaxID=28005 RepID=S9US80_9TRYP|nr:hypothetical protein STCU_10607 [Strigomonas culicis]|eukprot:EPY17446.1 hypothetical protein STCU_10607 [Strigomonas culicis]
MQRRHRRRVSLTRRRTGRVRLQPRHRLVVVVEQREHVRVGPRRRRSGGRWGHRKGRKQRRQLPPVPLRRLPLGRHRLCGGQLLQVPALRRADAVDLGGKARRVGGGRPHERHVRIARLRRHVQCIQAVWAGLAEVRDAVEEDARLVGEQEQELLLLHQVARVDDIEHVLLLVFLGVQLVTLHPPSVRLLVLLLLYVGHVRVQHLRVAAGAAAVLEEVPRPQVQLLQLQPQRARPQLQPCLLHDLAAHKAVSRRRGRAGLPCGERRGDRLLQPPPLLPRLHGEHADLRHHLYHVRRRARLGIEDGRVGRLLRVDVQPPLVADRPRTRVVVVVPARRRRGRGDTGRKILRGQRRVQRDLRQRPHAPALLHVRAHLHPVRALEVVAQVALLLPRVVHLLVAAVVRELQLCVPGVLQHNWRAGGAVARRRGRRRELANLIEENRGCGT